MDRLLFQLSEAQDSETVETALSNMLGESDKASPALAKLYGSLGLTDRYIKDLREAPKWADRTTAARALGQLGIVKTIPTLVEAMHDPQEDTRSVKLTAAQALNAIKTDTAVPLLLQELETLDEWASPRLAEVLLSFRTSAVPALLQALKDETHTNARV